MNFCLRLCLVCLALLASLVGCGKGPAHEPVAGQPSPSLLVAKCGPGQPGGRLTLSVAELPLTFNPMLVMDSASDAIVRMLFGTLVNLDQTTQEVGPGLADSWSVAADQKTWTFKLRPGVRWSDGEPLTADDIVFTWNEVVNNPDLNHVNYDLFRDGGKRFTVSKVDDLTVRVVTPEVFAPFVEYFGSVMILPEHTLAPAVKAGRFLTAYAPDARPATIVGCGPFRMKQTQPGKSVLLERNPEYWVVDKQGRHLPYFDEVMFLVADGPVAAAALLLNGKTDAADSVRLEDFDQLNGGVAGGRIQLAALGVGTERELLCFNQNTNVDAAGKPLVPPAQLKWFRNKTFRQAVSCAIDRDRLAHGVYGGRAQPSHGFISAESQTWHNADVPLYTWDPGRSRTLFEEMGLLDRNHDGILRDADGTPVEFTLVTNTKNPLREKCAQLIADDLWKLGVKVHLEQVEFRALVHRVNDTFDYQCVLMGLGGGGTDPASQMNVLKSGSALHQWFPEQKTPSTAWEARIDSLMDAQLRTLDIAQRKKDFNEVQSILGDELPMICTVTPFPIIAFRTDIGNARPSALTPFHLTWNIEELYFKKR